MRNNHTKILIKISWESLSDKDSIFNSEKVSYFADEIIKLSKLWKKIAIVFWWWNIWRARDNKNMEIQRVSSDNIWMLATLMNASVLSETLKSRWVDSVVYSSSACSSKVLAKDFNAISAKKDLDDWKIVFCAWWTWNPFFTTDTTAVLRALELWCSLVWKATKVDWVYDKNPEKFSDAKKLSNITYDEVLEKNLNVMDMSAFSLAKENDLEIFIFKMDEKNSFEKALKFDENIWSLLKKSF